ncbi:hypothetical protein [Sporomusa sphaeroides]|uniref:P-type conjugative transfer protein TrbJ n=1 Tax=Sporomusa sphaeroides DSM 2875 TaxID=1337886 RepID=A0A1U7M9R9_9FIRM|nr:hypothetical protein [Sporomusa sphaeroides]OLS54301.1 hypothetical protein SPSPH_45470 [Sporomusa sphaeroides DSM 2875]CVK21531.1 hypothetical protein SSPH_04223 [Sporomusa sphaeroides DSM 2875]
MLKKKFVIGALVLSLINCPVSEAAMAVIDNTVVSRLDTELNKWEQQLEYNRRQLMTLDPSNKTALEQQLLDIQQTQQGIAGLLNDYMEMQSQWDSIFTDYKEWSGVTGQDYIDDIQKVLDATNEAQKRALMAQGFVSEISNDQDTMNQLLSATQSAQGSLQVQQAANMILLLQAQQMARLQQMLSTSNQAQLLYLKQKNQDDQRVMSFALNSHGKPNPEAVKGQGYKYGSNNSSASYEEDIE